MSQTAEEKAEQYIRDFMESHGTHTEVSKKTGIKRATLLQVKEGRNRAGRDTIAALFKYYPDFDLVMALTGEPGEGEISYINPAVSSPSEDLSDTSVDRFGRIIEDMSKTISSLNVMVKDQQDQIKDYANGFMKLALKGFNPSDSHITAVEPPRLLVSMGRHDSPVSECKVMMHPATVERNEFLMLDSETIKLGA